MVIERISSCNCGSGIICCVVEINDNDKLTYKMAIYNKELDQIQNAKNAAETGSDISTDIGEAFMNYSIKLQIFL